MIIDGKTKKTEVGFCLPDSEGINTTYTYSVRLSCTEYCTVGSSLIMCHGYSTVTGPKGLQSESYFNVPLYCTMKDIPCIGMTSRPSFAIFLSIRCIIESHNSSAKIF